MMLPVAVHALYACREYRDILEALTPIESKRLQPLDMGREAL